jgi:ankyrin repeat protein
MTLGARRKSSSLSNDVTALSNYLRALVDDNGKTNRPRFYLGGALNAPDADGWRPLHHAYHLRRYQCAKLLIDAGNTW